MVDFDALKAKVDGGDLQAGWQLVSAARKAGKMTLAIDTAALLGARRLLVELAEENWAEPALRDRALAELGLSLSAKNVETIDQALATINGNHRKDLLLVEHIIQCLTQARHADDHQARRPRHGRFVWMARRTQRGFCRATRGDDTQPLQLTIGVEEVESYSTPTDISIAATIEVGTPALPDRPQIKSAIPADVVDRIKRPSGWFEGIMRTLHDHRDKPYYEEAVALAEQVFEPWPDHTRTLTHYATLTHIRSPHGRLLRGCRTLHEDFVRVMHETPLPLNVLRIIDLGDLRLNEGQDEDPLWLQRCTNLQHLGIHSLTSSPKLYERLAALRFPPSLRTFTLERLVPPQYLKGLVDNLIEDCPNLESFAFTPMGLNDTSAHNIAFGIIGAFPKQVSMELLKCSSVWGDAETFTTIYKQLDTHLAGRIRAAEVSDCKKDFPLLTALGRSELSKDLRRLLIKSTEAGGLSALFSHTQWHLEELEIEIQYARNMRFFRKKPVDAALSARDVNRLCQSNALTHVRALKIAGVIGHYNAPFMAEALAKGPAPLRCLRLYFSQISNKGLKAFIDAGVMRGVQELEPHAGKFSGKGLLALMDPDNGPQAPEILLLTKNSMGKAIIQALADWPALAHTRLLDLTDVRTTADNLAVLHGSPHLDRNVIRGQ